MIQKVDIRDWKKETRHWKTDKKVIKFTFQVIYIFWFSLLIQLMTLTPVLAHKVTVFAWVEGDKVHTQSKFSGGRPAKDSAVVVYDKEGNQLLEGKTDEKGEFSFPIPKKTELKVALKASMGHLAEWTIPAAEISPPSETIPSDSPSQSPSPPSQPEPIDSGKITNKESETCDITKMKGTMPLLVMMDRNELQKMIDTSLDKKLAPITQLLASSFDNKPGVTEIFGGVGYIVGLIGIALYFSNRRKTED